VAIFSISRKEPGAMPVPTPERESYAPYAGAWREFDKVQKLANGGGPLAFVHWAWGALFPLLGLFNPHRVPRKDSLTLLAVFGLLGAIQLIRSKGARNRFLHWPCPRCHSEWPGKKTEKDPCCAALSAFTLSSGGARRVPCSCETSDDCRRRRCYHARQDWCWRSRRCRMGGTTA
jgi:hypothetical protein